MTYVIDMDSAGQSHRSLDHFRRQGIDVDRGELCLWYIKQCKRLLCMTIRDDVMHKTVQKIHNTNLYVSTISPASTSPDVAYCDHRNKLLCFRNIEMGTVQYVRKWYL